jgi:diphthamide synthase (EF-2-diphthine--ammonia ligase)
LVYKIINDNPRDFITNCIRSSGREFDVSFLSELPKDVDPCGENGEFHSFVYAGPIFKKKIPFKKGEIVLGDEQFYFCDLI